MENEVQDSRERQRGGSRVWFFPKKLTPFKRGYSHYHNRSWRPPSFPLMAFTTNFTLGRDVSFRGKSGSGVYVGAQFCWSLRWSDGVATNNEYGGSFCPLKIGRQSQVDLVGGQTVGRLCWYGMSSGR